MHFVKKLGALIVLMLLCNGNLAASEDAAIEDSPNRDLTGFEGLNEKLPLWEAGVGGGMIETPNYPASAERNFVALALPYVIYRGDIFRVGGQGGARAVVVENERLELDMSFSGAFAADSDDNTAREGMPELDYLVEFGPQLIYKIKDFSFASGGNSRLNARLQARTVVSTDFGNFDARGFVFEPTLTYQQRGVFLPDTGLRLAFRMTWATEKLHDYFYAVTPEYATSVRPAYDAKGGYLGAELAASVAFPVIDNVRGFLSTSVQFNHGSANEESPLFEKDMTYSIGVGFVWRAYTSDAKASW
ncbi:MAG: MipA/OmpV family protein [Pseudomonadota bacterium]|nr:MipA/OmpV family protein [Pseudomonadota bacterium]RPH19645.1 MAG: MipA/OmpV family protein [Alteromonadaceae bacterium TMED7]|tara:strand:- start:1281 stop:2189 length:909 start_codon:yes stop_codon:yes gene_type:complete